MNTAPGGGRQTEDILELRPLRSAVAGLRHRLRALYLMHGLGRSTTVLGALLAVSFLLDWTLEPPRVVRLVHGLLSLGIFAWALRRFLVGPLGRRLADEELALAVEARVPSLQDRLIGALQWEALRADPDSDESEAFMEAAAAEATTAVRAVRVGALVDARPSRRSMTIGAVVVVGCIGGALAAPAEVGIWARRSLLLQEEAWPQRTHLHVLGLDPAEPHVVTIGDDVTLKVQVEGEVPSGGVEVHYETIPSTEGESPDRDRRAMLHSTDDERAFVFVFQEVPSSFRFFVTGGDDDDGEPVYTVTALVPPAIEQVTARLDFPPETGREPETRTEGDLEVPVGTTAALEVLANVPIRSAVLHHPVGAIPVDLVVEPDGRTVRFETVIRESADWRIDMLAADGARSVDARNTRRFTALPDPRPEIRLLLPASRVYALADARVPVVVAAKDNYSLTTLALEIVAGREAEPQGVPLAEYGSPGAPQRVRTARAYRLLDLASLGSPDGRGLRIDDEVRLVARAGDNGGSLSETDPVAVQIIEEGDLLRRVAQRQSRIREQLQDLRRHLGEARDGARRARDVLEAGGALEAGDRESLRTPASLAARTVRESEALVDDFGQVLLTYVWNRLVDNRVATERAAATVDRWLRTDSEARDGEVTGRVLQPDLWRTLADAGATGAIDDNGILGSLLQSLGLTDRLARGPTATLRDRLGDLAGDTTDDPAAAAAEAVAAADAALLVVREIQALLQDWESLHEVLEAMRSVKVLQDRITDDLLGGAAAPGEAPQDEGK